MKKESITSTMWIASDTTPLPPPPCVNEYAEPMVAQKSEKHLVYGLKGIADFLHQSITTAWRLKKSGKYDAAISQHGRCIITDTDKLLELMRLDQANKEIEFTPYYNNIYDYEL